jgi:hypothetical protein
MAVDYRTTLKTTRMNAVLADIDSGAGAGYIEICSAGYAAVLATITLADPCGTVTTDTLTLTMPQSDVSADNTGTAAVARIKESTGTTIVNNLTVGTSGANINLNSLSITSGGTVTLTAGTLVHG